MGKSTRNFGLALVAAALFHGLLLAQKLVFKELPVSKDKSLTVTILQEDNPEPTETPVAEPETNGVAEKTVDPKPLPPKVDKLIVATKPVKETEPRVVIQTSLQSPLYKNWLKSETENFTANNPEVVDKFDQTFEEQLPYQSPEELSPSNPKSIPRGSTTFKVESEGKRTCMAKILNLLDASASPSFTKRDCTPKEKFDLKLNQPNNGWTNR